MKDIKYVWVDEDDEVMSPIHGSLGAALGFAGDWQEKWDKAQATFERAEATPEDHRTYSQRQILENAEKTAMKLTKTGKPPHRLKYHVTTVTIEDMTDAEDSAAQLVLRRSHGE